MVQRLVGAFSLLLIPGLAFRQRNKRKASPVTSSWAQCSWIGCGSAYNRSRYCQCNDRCRQYSNCCDDYAELCESSPGPAPGPSPPTPPSPPNGPTPPTPPSPPNGPSPPPSEGAASYWRNTNMDSLPDIQSRLRGGARKLSYGALWTAYKKVWVGLPGGCKNGVYDVYSTRCWTPGSSQCGSYRKEGDCYNREHSWPKSWWGRAKNSAYSDMFHVMPSDGYVNGRRGSFPFGKVSRPTYTSSEGNKVGPCNVSGYSGTCFEPTDRVKGLLARGQLYMAVRYKGEWGCCSNDAVDGADMKSWTTRLMLEWHAAFPPQAWEAEFNERAYQEQGNRNPFIDYGEVAQQIFG